MVVANDIPAGTRLGAYKLLRKIAAGGMGEIYLARQGSDRGLPAVVAIKTIRATFIDDPQIVPMFLQEARIGLALQHPNIVQVYDLGQRDGKYYIVMQHVDGLSLHRCLKQTAALPTDIAIKIAAEVAAALQYVHQRRDRKGKLVNLVHRDISPGNILLSFDGDVKITDFGIAKFKWSSTKTQAGMIKGKFAYLAPEQARGETVDHRTDIFALGLVLYEMTTGHRAYRGEDGAVLQQAAIGRVAPPAEGIEGYPLDLQAVVMRALAPEPEDRYCSCTELQQDLLQLVASRLDGPTELPTSKQLGKLVRHLAREEREAKPDRPGSISGALGERVFHRRTPPRALLTTLLLAGCLVALGLLPWRGSDHGQGTELRPVQAASSAVANPPSNRSRGAARTARSDRSLSARHGRRRKLSRRRRAKARQASRSPGRDGALTLRTWPSTEVFAGKRRLGRTPLTVSLSSEQRELALTFKAARLGLLAKRTIRLHPGRDDPVELRFVRGQIRFALQPGLHVRVDGRPLGTTPLPLASVFEGPHTVQVTRPFRYVTQTYRITVRPAKITTVSDRQ